MSVWRFAGEIGEERIGALSVAPTFDVIVSGIEREMTVLCYHPQQCCDNRDFSRVIYCIRVPGTLFDLFFNSENGYRGSYFDSPYVGLEANAMFIQSLEARLLEWTRANRGVEGISFARESLRTPSAKAWLAERSLDLCDLCAGEWGAPHDDAPGILNGRWEVSDQPAAKSGRKAPYLTKLKIFGAFLNDRHDEFIAARKRHRAQDVHRFGWS
jgi:hypothetical protein